MWGVKQLKQKPAGDHFATYIRVEAIRWFQETCLAQYLWRRDDRLDWPPEAYFFQGWALAHAQINRGTLSPVSDVERILNDASSSTLFP